MEKTVILYTQAYNAANTLQRTIESVKKQTYTNFIHYIIDNGSSDATGKIIMRAAVEDTRVVPYRLSHNNITAMVKFWILIKKRFPNCYFMPLDADDVIHPDCLEKMVAFLEENELDIAACGTDFTAIDVQGNEEILRTRNLDESLIIEREELPKYFKVYKPYTNEYWAKLYRTDIIEESHMACYTRHHYDSLVVLHLIGASKRFGIWGETLHKAYIRDGSLSQAIKGIGGEKTIISPLEAQVSHWLDGTAYVRVAEYQDRAWEQVNMAYEEYKKFLEAFGEISEENREYLCAIYIDWIHENLTRLYLVGATMHGGHMYQNVLRLISSEEFREVFLYNAPETAYKNLQKRQGILKQMYNYLSISEYAVGNCEFIRNSQCAISDLQKEMELC